MGRSGPSVDDVTELLERASSVAKTLCMCAPSQPTQVLRDQFSELGQRLAGLVAIGKCQGGAAIVAGAIRDTFEEVDRMADLVIRLGKN